MPQILSLTFFFFLFSDEGEKLSVVILMLRVFLLILHILDKPLAQ